MLHFVSFIFISYSHRFYLEQIFCYLRIWYLLLVFCSCYLIHSYLKMYIFVLKLFINYHFWLHWHFVQNRFLYIKDLLTTLSKDISKNNDFSKLNHPFLKQPETIMQYKVIVRERPFNLEGGYGFFLKKYSDSQCCWKKYSDFGGGKKKSDSESFCHIILL